METKVKIFGAGVLLFILFFVWFGLKSESNAASPEVTPQPIVIPTLKDSPIENDYRYILFPKEEKISYAFEKLPNMPYDFKAVRAKFYAGQLPPERITEKYYLQPEFYEEWENRGFIRYQEPFLNEYSIAGYGAFPAEYIALTNPNDEFTAYTFIYSDFSSEYWQGVFIEPEILSEVSMKKNSYHDDTRTIKQNVSYVKAHIQVEVSPNEFLIEPARSRFKFSWNGAGEIVASEISPGNFDKDWSRKITFKFKTKDLASGKYAIVFNLKPPSGQFSLKQSSKYLTRYLDAGNTVSSGWQFGVFLDVQ